MNNYLRAYCQNVASKRKQEREQEVADMFNIAMKDNKLWITHNGYAIKEIPDTAMASEIIAEISNYQETAKKYGTGVRAAI